MIPACNGRHYRHHFYADPIPGLARRSTATSAPRPHGQRPLQCSSNRISNTLGIGARYLLALACLAGGMYQTHRLLHLTNAGRRADATVIGIDVDAKGGKRAMLQLVTATGDTVVSRDLIPVMVFRFNNGDHVTVLYDPSDPGLATIDLGVWTWQQPVFFYSGFALLGLLGLLLARARPVRPRQPVADSNGS